jgi:multidrug efflux system outer membrane protein
MMKSIFSVTLLAATLIGCTMIPEYKRPAAPVAAAYPTGAAYHAPEQMQARPDGLATGDIGWREFFTDPLLQALITRALNSNRDLRVAALNVEAARAQYRIERANLLPGLGVGGAGTIQRVPADLSVTQRATTSRQFQVSGSIPAWELDLFGRIRSLSQQALQTYLAQDETRLATELALIAEVASAYLTLRADQELLSLTEETLASQRQSYELTRQAFEGGVGTQLQLSQAEVLVRTAEQNYALYTRTVALGMNALSLLLGESLSDDLRAQLARANYLDDDALPTQLPAGLPSDLLVRRPDIRSAEHQLLAANARIGAARAAFFPTISLTGSAGTASSSLGGLFDGGSGAWSFAPRISVPLFTGGALRASLDAAEIRRDAAVAQYELAIQSGFREVADALAGRGTYDQQIASQRALVDANQRAYDVSDQLFREGISNYLEVLDSQRSLYSSQQNLVQTRLGRLNNLVTFYKVLGGGWTEHTVIETPPDGQGLVSLL